MEQEKLYDFVCITFKKGQDSTIGFRDACLGNKTRKKNKQVRTVKVRSLITFWREE